MKLIKPSFEIWEHPSGLEGIYKQIERAGRVCYKSENKITENSAKSFVDRLIKSGHSSVLEHGTVYLTIPFEYVDMSEKLDIPIVSDVVEKYKGNPYTKWYLRDDGFSQLAFITTNMRILVENNWFDDLKYLCEPTEFHEKRITTYFISDIHFYKDITRHRHMSFSIESTRYCNYSKDRWGNEINFAIPVWLKEEEELEFEEDLKVLEQLYFKWINKGWQPQQAAYFLAQGTKAEIVMTGFISDYKHFFNLRALGTTGKPHPTVEELAIPLREEFIKRGYINE